MRICSNCAEVYGDDTSHCRHDGTPLRPWSDGAGQAPSVAGPLVGERYRLVRQIGVGGFGVVFEARDERLKKRVALKVLSPAIASTPEARRRFENEAVAASRVGHPGIVQVTDFHRDAGGTDFLVMELLEGRDLAGWRKEIPRTPARLLEVTAQVARAVQAAHEAGIVHRDLKPANVFVTADEQVKVLDFGISKMLEPEAGAERLTGGGQVLGSPTYMSPEQARGDAQLDGRTDVYSLGVMLYELLVGEPPFRAAKPLGVVTQHLLETPVPPSARLPRAGVPSQLDTLVLTALAKRPEDRFASMRAFSEALERVAAELPVDFATTPLVGSGAPVEASVTRTGGHPPVGAQATPAASVRLTATGGGPLAPRRWWRGVAGVLLLATTIGAVVLRVQARDRVRPPRQLTQVSGCAARPVPLAGGALAFGHLDGAHSTIEVLSLGTGVTRTVSEPQVTAACLNPGRTADELTFVALSDTTGRVHQNQLVLATEPGGRQQTRPVPSNLAVVRGEVTYYVRLDGGELRKIEGAHDDSLVEMPAHRRIHQLAASPDGRWLGMVTEATGGARVCLVELTERPVVRCLDQPRVVPSANVTFTSDSRTALVAGVDGVHRLTLSDGGDVPLAPGLFAGGGLALVDDGRTLVFSNCQNHGPLLDVTANPPTVFLDEPLPREPCAGPAGVLVYARDRNGRLALVVRHADGTERELPQGGQASATSPALDATGRQLAYRVTGERAGIWVRDTEGTLAPEPLTQDDSDSNPAWTGEGKVVFTRWDELHNPYVFIADPKLGAPSRAHPKPRRTIAAHHPSGRVLLSSTDKKTLYLWDPRSGEEHEVDLGPLAGSYVMAAALSLDGQLLVVQTGVYGREVWRVWLAGGRPPEKLFEGGPGQDMSSAAVLSDGRVVVGPRTRVGQLFEVGLK